jgi:hypothetical protein
MHTQSALTKLQVILLIDIVVVAAAAGGYFYIQSLPAPPLDATKIQLTALTLDKTEALIGQPIKISVNVTNIGGEAGSYWANLIIDGDPNQAQTILLPAGETKTVEFVVSNAAEGAHSVTIGNIEERFTVLGMVELTDLAINRTEARVGEPLGITIKVTNRAEESGSYSVTLTINGTAFETKTLQLGAKASANTLFEVVEQTEGTYVFKIGSLNGTFSITSAAPPPKPAEFQLTNLIIDPQVTDQSTPVTISIKVTNVGETTGSYPVDLKINDAVKESKTVQLAGGETTTATFTVTEATKGTYAVVIGNLTGEFTVQSPSTITMVDLFVKPYEAWAGEPVNITATATNQGTTTSSVSVKLTVDNDVVETRAVTLAGGQTVKIEFTANVTTEGIHAVKVNNLDYGIFKVVKTGYHTLSVSSAPKVGADFTLNGVSHKTFYSELLPVGTYTVAVPATDPTGKFTFTGWDTGSMSPSITVNLQTSQITVTASFTGGTSCPSLFFWNGTSYKYVQEISNHGWLGYTRYVNEDGSLEYWRNNPWDYIPLNNSQLQSTNGSYNINLSQLWDEIFFVDTAYMMVVDHPSDQNVYSTMVEQYIDPSYMGQIYTVSKNPLEPVSAFNEIVNVVNGTVYDSNEKVDTLSQISKTDGVFTTGFNGKYSQAWNNQTWNRLTLNLGNLTGASQIKLVVRSVVNWGPAESYTLWMDKFYGTQVPNHTEPTPTPFMEVKDANGNWVRVPESRQFPLPPDTLARTYVVDLTGLFPTNDYSLRISNFWNVTFDYIGVDTTPQQNVTIQKINPQANLYQAFVSPATSTGNFTRYGNVTELLLNEDDEFVIGRQGDTISLQFPTDNLSPIPEGMERDYFFFAACWFKVEYANYGFGPGHNGFTVDPLPFHNMSGFPYPLDTESYPYDAAHLAYLQEWNTRVINPPSQPQPQESAFTTWVIAVIIIVAVINVCVLVRFKKRS